MFISAEMEEAMSLASSCSLNCSTTDTYYSFQTVVRFIVMLAAELS